MSSDKSNGQARHGPKEINENRAELCSRPGSCFVFGPRPGPRRSVVEGESIEKTTMFYSSYLHVELLVSFCFLMIRKHNFPLIKHHKNIFYDEIIHGTKHFLRSYVKLMF